METYFRIFDISLQEDEATGRIDMYVGEKVLVEDLKLYKFTHKRISLEAGMTKARAKNDKLLSYRVKILNHL